MRRKLEEEKVARFLNEAGISFKQEHHVTFSCWNDTNARADFLIVDRGGVIVLEVDEHEHECYGVLCDVARMTKMHAAFAIEGNTLPVAFIRYNPHAFRVDGVVQSVPTQMRLLTLVSVIKSWVFTDASLEIQYMYYSGNNDQEGEVRLSIWDSEEYNQNVQDCCLTPIV